MAAKQDVSLQLFYSGSWHDVDTDVFVDDQIVITRGQGDEDAAFRPSSTDLTFNNATDKYRPSNPTSPLYGLAGRNTPVRAMVGSDVRNVTEATSWKPSRTIDFRASPPRGRAEVALESNGVLQRINQWTDPPRSPFYDYNAAQGTGIGYWSLEQERGAVWLNSPVEGSTSIVPAVGAEFESQSKFAGSGPMCDFGGIDGRGFMSGQFTPGNPNSTAGWQFSCCARMGSVPAVGSLDLFELFEMKTGDNGTVMWGFYNGSFLLKYDRAGVSLVNLTFTTDVTDYVTKFNCFILTCTQVSTTVTMSAYWMTEGSDVFAGPYSASFTGQTSCLDDWRIFGGGNGYPAGSTVGHFMGTAGTADSLLFNTRVAAFKGYDQERAGDRFTRLCTARGITSSIVGDPADTMPMGPQGVDTLPKQLEEIRDTEDALIFDDIDAAALVLVTRKARSNQSVAFALAWPFDISTSFAEVLDDLDAHNVVEAQQRDGPSVTRRDDTSPLGTADPPAGIGEYRQTKNVNVANPTDDLVQLANWWLRRGTVNTPRFAAVTVDLVARPSLVPAVAAVDVGDRITITGYVEYVIDLIVIGWKETIGSHSRSITYVCAPGNIFQLGVLNTGRAGARYTTLNAGLTSTATTLVLKSTADGEQWRPGSSSAHVLIAGEEIALGTIGARTGSGPWTWTVTGCARSVNAIVKAQASGAPVAVKDTIRLGLRETP